MRRQLSIRARIVVGAGVVLTVFLLLAGYALDRTFTDNIRSAHYQRLQSHVYLLLAAAELDAGGGLAMPAGLAEPRFSLPDSGLYANIANPGLKEEWQSLSTLGLDVPFLRQLEAGEWRFTELHVGGRTYLAAAYGVKWATGPRAMPLTFAVSEDEREFRREIGQFQRNLWVWLGGAAVVLLLAQTALLGWGLTPLGRVARELRRIEAGEQARVQGVYPVEIAALTDNLNGLIEHERARQMRYKDALGDLAHSLKTPLAVLRSALAEPATLAQTVTEQVGRMDHIVQYQLARAAASGSAQLAPPLAVVPVARRILDSLAKVYRERELAFELAADPHCVGRVDEGDLFEILGNLLDNAAKWAGSRVRLSLSNEGRALRIVIEDDGPGIADPSAVLQRGMRADERVPGQGIGLAVVADIVAAYGGDLDIGRSEQLGGAAIRLRLAK
ncbi:ATP-binding protein [Chitinimonas lacunae]|uniref:histidine kinase n=1 Tax=Chitinimonas lacunae TaxID=1963018 RepID=A0ABV8MN25_9NEIS